MVFYLLFSIFLALCLAIYFTFLSHFKWWKKIGVTGPRPSFPLGNITPALLGKISIPYFLKKLYEDHKDESFIGFFVFNCPILMLKDPEHMKHILIRDFSKFDDRGFLSTPKVEPLTQCLPQTAPPNWRPLRLNMTSIFTTAKMRAMFNLMSQSARQFEQQLDELVGKGEVVNWCDTAAEFTVETIGYSLIGIPREYLDARRNEFLRIAKMNFGHNLESNIRLKLRLIAPIPYDALGSLILPERIQTPFFMKVVKDVMDYRDQHGIVKSDVIGMCLAIRNQEDSGLSGDLNSILASQVATFLTLGVEVVSLVTRHGLYELAQNQRIQDKLREEIREFDAKYKGLEYDRINDLKYLDKVYKETLRKYPSVSLMSRRSNTEYTFEDSKVTIEKDQLVAMSIVGIHYDPDYYPNPETFDPERFTPEAIAARHPMNYLPFGTGPRNCIGMRFVMYQAKLSLYTILRNFKVDVCDKTMIPYVPSPNTLSLSPAHDIYLKTTKVDS